MANPSYISSNPLSGSNTETALGVDISTMSNGFKEVLDDWARENGGACFIADDDSEKINIGFNNAVGPRVLIVFTGEEPYLDEQISDMVPYVKRNWDILVQRGKVLSDPRNNALTSTNGPSRAFYELVEEARDLARQIAFPAPMAYNPNIYNGMRPGRQDEWMMDSYVISISVICQIPRIQYNDPALVGNGPFVNTMDPPQFSWNGIPNTNV